MSLYADMEIDRSHEPDELDGHGASGCSGRHTTTTRRPVGRPSAIAHVILDWLWTPGPDGELVPWRVTELSAGVGAAASTVGQQLGTLLEAGLVEHAGNAYAPRGIQPQLWRAVEPEAVVVEEGGHAAHGAGAGPAEVTGGPSDGVAVDDRGRSRTPADTHEEVQ